MDRARAAAWYAPNALSASLDGFKDYVDTGLIAPNAYLLAASQGLAAWFHDSDKTNTVTEFKLRPEQRVLFAQTVGYPVKA